MEPSLVVSSCVHSAASLTEQNASKGDDYLQSTDSAFFALTDFRQEPPITVDAGSSIDAALAEMMRLGVHALLVTDEEFERGDLRVLGLITAYDIERQRPHRSPSTIEFRVLKAIKVAEVMTPWNELSLVNYESLQTLTALNLYEMFQGTGLTHLLVVDAHGDDSASARGLLSRSTLAKRLRHGRNTASYQVEYCGRDRR
jgi:CBS domain-containing protein